jgi:serine/threonine protein kinase
MTKIAHRDLKADNVLVWIEGKKVKIIDFGLSKAVGGTLVHMHT